MPRTQKQPLVFIYARMSKDGGSDGLKIERTIRQCHEVIEDLGLTGKCEVRLFSDNDLSASEYATKVRPDWQRFLDALVAEKPAFVVARSVDRLTRQHEEGVEFERALLASGARLVTHSEGPFDLTAAHGSDAFWSAVTRARTESKRTSTRLRDQALDLAKRGGWPGGCRPFGFDYMRSAEIDPDTGKHKVIPGSGLHIVEHEAKLIQEAARDIVNGKTVGRIAREWNEAGVTTVQGKMWRTTNLNRFMKSRVLRGERVHLGEVVARDCWEAILDPDLALEVEAVLTTNRQRPGDTRRRNYLSGGITRCTCERWMSTWRGDMRCDKDTGGCGRRNIKIARLDAVVRELTVARLLIARDSLVKAQQLRNASESAEAKSNAVEIRKLEQKQRGIELMLNQDEITEAQFKRMNADVRQQLDKLHAVVRAEASTVVLSDLPPTREELLARWDAGDLDYRQALIRSVFEYFEIQPVERKGAPFDEHRVRPVLRSADSAL